MIRFFTTWAVALLLVTVGGCNQSSTSVTPPTTTSTPITGSSPVEAASDWRQAMALDEGKKWEANIETTTGVQEMLGIIEKAEAKPAEIDPQAVHAELSAALQELIQKCSMTGPSHDQLHHYLVPLMAKLEELEKEPSAEAAALTLADIKSQLQGYGEYFQ